MIISIYSIIISGRWIILIIKFSQQFNIKIMDKHTLLKNNLNQQWGKQLLKHILGILRNLWPEWHLPLNLPCWKITNRWRSKWDNWKQRIDLLLTKSNSYFTRRHTTKTNTYRKWTLKKKQSLSSTNKKIIKCNYYK